MKNSNDKKAVVVTTAHKGVFFGFADPKSLELKTLRIEQAQMCVYWSTGVRGIVGLAANGPDKQCKVTPAAPAMTLHEVTSVMECSSQAEEAWKSQPWN
jgi:hypothetical protein